MSRDGWLRAPPLQEENQTGPRSRRVRREETESRPEFSRDQLSPLACCYLTNTKQSVLERPRGNHQATRVPKVGTERKKMEIALWCSDCPSSDTGKHGVLRRIAVQGSVQPSARPAADPTDRPRPVSTCYSLLILRQSQLRLPRLRWACTGACSGRETTAGWLGTFGSVLGSCQRVRVDYE